MPTIEMPGSSETIRSTSDIGCPCGSSLRIAAWSSIAHLPAPQQDLEPCGQAPVTAVAGGVHVERPMGAVVDGRFERQRVVREQRGQEADRAHLADLGRRGGGAAERQRGRLQERLDDEYARVDDERWEVCR